MRRVCLLVDDDPGLLLSVPRALEWAFNRAWGPNHGIELIKANSFDEGYNSLVLLAADANVRCALVTDYDLGYKQTGSELIAACRKLLGQDRSVQVLQSGTPVSELLHDPVVRSLPEGLRLVKPVQLAGYEGLVPTFGGLWELSLEG